MLSLKEFKSNELYNSSLKLLVGGLKATTYTVNGGASASDTLDYATCQTTYDPKDKLSPTNDPNMCQG